jgi:ribosomal protein S18 acetylase RimI-like enzyme
VHSNDVDTLAELLVQLYGAEEPGVLRSPREGQLSLFRHILAHELAVTTGGRFLAVDAAGVPLGSASMRLYGDSIPSTLPSSLLVTALRQVGFADTLRFFGYLLRSSLASETVLRRRECYIYSVVVDAGARRRGVGYAMMEQLEAYARRAGVNAALLRVMEGNEPARQLYRRLGYRRVSGSAAFARWLGMPSELMRKELV